MSGFAITAEQIRAMMAEMYPILGRIWRGEPVSQAELDEFVQQIQAIKIPEFKPPRAAEWIADLLRRYPSMTGIRWMSAGCSDCAHLDGLEWMNDLHPIGHDTPLEQAPPLKPRCSAILLPVDNFSLVFSDTIRAKAFDAADLLIETMRNDHGSEEWQRLKAEVAGRKAAHQAGQRFNRKKHLPERFW